MEKKKESTINQQKARGRTSFSRPWAAQRVMVYCTIYRYLYAEDIKIDYLYHQIESNQILSLSCVDVYLAFRLSENSFFNGTKS